MGRRSVETEALRGVERGSTGSERNASTRARERCDWRSVLSGRRPRQVLTRLLAGDPLGVREHVAERLRARAYLMDADRVFLRSLARCARFAGRYRGQPPLEAWLAERVDEALLDLLDEDPGAEPDAGEDGIADLARPLGLDPAEVRFGCARFNHLPNEDRRAFQDLVLEGCSLDDLVRRTGVAAPELARRARRGLDALLAGRGGEVAR